MKRILSILYTVLISVLITSLAFAGGIPGTFPNMPPMAPQEDHGVVFRYDPSRNPTLDFASRTDLTQTYAGDYRTRINAQGNLEAVPASTPVIDHIGTSLAPALRVEPQAANIILGNPPATQDLSFSPGTFTLQVFGAGTCTVSANTATITGAGEASDGTPVTFVVTVGGTVTFTMADSPTQVSLTPGAIASSYFAPAAAIGSELVTDGGFDAVTEGADIFNNDFSSDTSWLLQTGWSHDAVGLKYDCDGSQISDSRLAWENTFLGTAKGNNFLIEFEILNYSAGSVAIYLGAGSVPVSFTADGVYAVYINSGWSSTDYDNFYLFASADFVGSVKSATIKPVTFTNWTGWVPQATSGSLTGKAYKAASNSDNLEQTSLAAEAGKVYRIVWTLTKSAGDAGDGITAEFGSTDGTLRTASGTYVDYIIAADTDYLKFKPTDSNANLVVTIDDASAMEHGTVRGSEAGSAAPTLAFDADQAALLAAATGQMAIVWTPGASKQALSGNHNIWAHNTGATNGPYLASADGTISISDGTNTATTAYSYVANTPAIITWYWADGKMKIGACAVGATSITWGSEANYDGSFNPGANAIFGAGAVYMPQWYGELRGWTALQTDNRILRLR